MTKVMPLKSIHPSASDKYLFDTNVWLYIQGPYADPFSEETIAYSDFYARVKRAGAQIFVSFLQVSEFINRYVKIVWDREREGGSVPEKLKRFRQTEVYRDTIRDASDELFHILSDCIRVDFNFGIIPLTQV